MVSQVGNEAIFKQTQLYLALFNYLWIKAVWKVLQEKKKTLSDVAGLQT